MKWIDKLEVKFGRYAIHGLVRMVVACEALVFVLYLVDPHFLQLLTLDPELVKRGQIWRLVTYIFIPPVGGSWLMPDYLWIVFSMLFMWMLGEGLEAAWGAFKLNMYYLIGMTGTAIVALIFGSGPFGSLIFYYGSLLYLSLLFAFATIDPNYQIYYIVIPLKIKWVAWFSAAMLAYNFINGFLALRMTILFALANYLVFFGPELVRMAIHYNQVAARRQKFARAAAPDDDAMHRCEVCKRTELGNPDLEFRVSADGHEYCLEHLPAKKPVT